jgi:hypothetical protein
MGVLKMKLNESILKDLVLEVMKENELQAPVAEAELPAGQASSDAMTAFDALSGPDGASQIAFISAENPPKAEGVDFPWNDSMMLDYLKMDLDKLGYDYHQILGEYGGEENSLMVIGGKKMRESMKSDMIYLGKKYLQDSVIVGQKFYSQKYAEEDSALYRMRFEMIDLKPTKVGKANMDIDDYEISEMRDMVMRGSDVQARTEFYSKVGNKKFVIPFFSEEAEHQPAETEKEEFPIGKSRRD